MIIVSQKVVLMMSNEEINNFNEYARYKYVIENIKDVIWEMDTKLVFTFVSPTINGMAGYVADEMVGRCILDFLTAESKAHIVEQWKHLVHKRIEDDFRNVVLYDLQLICKDGNTIWCEACVKPIFRGKNFIGYIGTTRDITDKKLCENKANRYLEELKYKNEKLENLATLDMLTGAYNRRKFEYFICLEIEKKKNYGSPFSIIMFDIDNFKGINDHYGHKKGDRILQDITALIKHTLRVTDKLFRWGGDEFIILLPELTLKNAFKVADKVRETVQSYNFDIENKEVTVSLGVGEYTLNENLDQFVTRVDKALLKAKSYGRNKTEQS